MRTFGKCEVCAGPIICREYKLKGPGKVYGTVYRCKSRMAHTHSEEYIKALNIDVAYYRAFSESERQEAFVLD